MKKPQLDQGRGNADISKDSTSSGADKNRPRYTGRHFVILKEPQQDYSKMEWFLKNKLGFRTACSRDFLSETFTEEKIKDADAYFYEELGIALISGSLSQINILETETAEFILEPERMVNIPDDIPSTMVIPDTWGIEATKVNDSPYTGKGIKVAVLDTGFAVNHPDFEGREVIAESFVEGENADDFHGHGTHCIGTACGAADMEGLRYGIAKESIIYTGKVLNNQGSGAESWVIDGITWAANNGCKVISMSLGSAVLPGEGYSLAYERTAKNALSKGAVLVAAAGNDSSRSRNVFRPVGSPANCPSIVAVGAVDAELNIADFSNRAINPDQLIDIVAPGVDIYSSFSGSMRYRTISGTSMAAPHVAGILALLWEKYPSQSPNGIIEEMQRLAHNLKLGQKDIGSGLVNAPLE
ncbi:MAG: S8 family serine peptidase [Anditalea sp.]